MKPKNVSTQYLVVMLTVQHKQMQEVAALTGMSRQGIYKRLKKAGIDSSDRYWVTVDCTFCGNTFDKLWKLWAKNTNGRNYCTTECYYADRENPGYKPWRQGSRIARAIVAQYFRLEKDHVVDHKDGNQRNNDRSNLRVYASQSDHIKMHHGKTPVEPLWDGAK